MNLPHTLHEMCHFGNTPLDYEGKIKKRPKMGAFLESMGKCAIFSPLAPGCDIGLSRLPPCFLALNLQRTTRAHD